jgi:AraC-like DNA-binding protein
MQTAAIIGSASARSIDAKGGVPASHMPMAPLLAVPLLRPEAPAFVAPRAMSSLLLPATVWEGLMSELTDAVIVLRLIYQAMKKAGVDADAVLNRLGMVTSQLDNASLRTPHAGHHLFWRAVEEVTGDPDAGLHLAPHIPVFRGQVLEYLFLSSPTFGDGIKRAQKYQRLLSDAVESRLELTPAECYLAVLRAGAPGNPEVGVPRHSIDCVAMGLMHFFSHITEGAFRAEKICFTHRGGENPAEYEKVFGCPVLFGQPENRIHFNRLVLARPSPHAELDLLRLHEQVASDRVAELERRDLVAQVRRIIGESLEDGEVSLEHVASRLGIKPRALRTRLAEADTSFNHVLADYRCRLAKRLLAGTDETIDQIVYLTGFSEPSTFYRAFKRWVGETPIEYRKRKKAE